jgi:prepilin-type N-terminal cleavage/methylation domain-containing protein
MTCLLCLQRSQTMKKAFTLIELLVVIAIIAILAAILFPVFAQAKLAAKRTVALSNVKQTGTGLQIYVADYDDTLPRNDDCTPELMNKTLSNVPFNPTGAGCTFSAGVNGYLYRKNHFTWQAWLMPYIKNVDIFFLPTRQRNDAAWAQNNIVDQFGLNTGLTGALNTYGNANRNGAFRNSWIGGNMTAIPSPSEAMLFMEIGGAGTPHIQHATVDPFTNVQTSYPVAIRELWRYKLMEGTAADCVAGTKGTVPDNRKTSNGLIALGFSDSSAKAMPAQKFLDRTPTYAEFGATITFPSPTAAFCTNTGGNIGISSNPNSSLNYPMWGFGQ